MSGSVSHETRAKVQGSGRELGELIMIEERTTSTYCFSERNTRVQSGCDGRSNCGAILMRAAHFVIELSVDTGRWFANRRGCNPNAGSSPG